MMRFCAAAWWVASIAKEGAYCTPTPDEKLPYFWKALDSPRVGVSHLAQTVVGEANGPDEFLVCWTVPLAVYTKFL